MDTVIPLSAARPKVLEFFAGIGLARLGLEEAGFTVAWSNDYEPAKKSMYEANFGVDRPEHEFRLGDIGGVSADELPDSARLAWASSPCTDLSLAGARAGLGGRESGTFWHFIRILTELKTQDRLPEIAVLENVTGLATSHAGEDLAAAIRAFNALDYSVDVLALDARRFLPQSRPRLFIVAAQNPPALESNDFSELRPDWLQWVFSDRSLRTHKAALPAPPPLLMDGLGNFVEEMSLADERWWDQERTEQFLRSLSPTQLARVSSMRKARGVQYRTAYRRTRKGVAVWEVRPDDVSGCLRTARGGSSKQAVVRMGGGRIRVRWMTPREYARLMGAGSYDLSGARTNQALFGFGDAVAVPAVSWLGENYLMPLLSGTSAASAHSSEAANG